MKLKKMLAASIAALTVCGALDAQARGGRSQPPEAQDQGAMCRMDDHIDGQLGYIQAELKITETQAAQWNVFADAFRADKQKQAQACRMAQEQARSMSSAPLPESMRMMADRLSARLDSMRAMQAAIGPLYASLTQDQKKKADEIMKGAPGM